MLKRACWGALVAFGLAAACGGKAVVDPETRTSTGGSGAATTTSSTSSSGTTTSSGTAGAGGSASCELLQDLLEEAIATAQWCDPLINELQCTGQTVIMDPCGCEVVANDATSDAAAGALAAYDEWVALGCGPFDCMTCPPPPSTPWYCDGDLMRCEPAYE